MTVVFISWSGEVSREIAEELRNWIPSVLQFAKPYYTPNDIEKGAKWSSEISGKLSEANVGIIVLTKENHQKPWILFEAGALSKDIEKSKVCSILFGMENSDISGPLTTFQTTEFRKSDFKKMMKSINDTGGETKLNTETFDRVFEMWWPQLNDNIQAILGREQRSKEEARSDRELIEEILLLSRSALKSSSQPGSLKVPLKVLEDFTEALSGMLSHYEKDEKKSNYIEIETLLKIGQYLSRNADKGYRYGEEISRLKSKFDDIIPF